MSNQYVINFFNVKDGNPADIDSRVSSPFAINRMCTDLIYSLDVIDEADLVGAMQREADANSVTLSPTYADDVKDMGWGEWVEVGIYIHDRNERMFVVKVVDAEVEAIPNPFVNSEDEN